MPQSLSSILIHLIFSTKNREPFLTSEIDAELYPYMASIFKAMKSPALIINGTSDHIHTLFSLSPRCDNRVSGGRSEDRILKVDQNEREAVSKFPLAERLRSVLHWSIASVHGEAIHHTPEKSIIIA